ncbi:MAG: hypothetical protein IJP04_03430 [Clostridia bacterium]|nr:hypothetical protein [Clostridia bacterium]
MIDRFERFSFAISEISRQWHKIAADELEKYHLKGPYATYFTTLYRFPEGIPSARLSELCGRDKSDVSRAVAGLEKQGLVAKEGVGGNFYRAKLRLTEEGKKVAEHINDRARIAVELGGNGLTDEEREIFYHALELIVTNLQALSREGLPDNETKSDSL